jgi:hypothetical protein
MTAWTLELPSGELFATLQVLLAVRTGKFKLGHMRCAVFGQNMH